MVNVLLIDIPHFYNNNVYGSILTFMELRLEAALATTSPNVAGGKALLRSTNAHAHKATARHHRTRILISLA